jgi:hypothetical protein
MPHMLNAPYGNLNKWDDFTTTTFSMILPHGSTIYGEETQTLRDAKHEFISPTSIPHCASG